MVDGNVASLVSAISGETFFASDGESRHLLQDHQKLILVIEDLGYGHAVRDEIEGVSSCIEAIGVAGAVSLIKDQLEPSASDFAIVA